MLKQSGTLFAFLGLIYLSAATETIVAAKSSNLPQSSQVLMGNTLYYIQRISKNWFDARKSCEGMGYNLISLDTTEKWNAIHSYLDAQNDHFHYWTSGNDFLTLGWHVWFPSGKAIPWEYWYPGEPNNYNGIEHCDEFRFKGSRKMNDEDCTRGRYYICERTL